MARTDQELEQARNDRELVRKFAADTEYTDLRDAIYRLIGRGDKGGGNGRSIVIEELRKLLIEKGEVDGAEIFGKFRMGEADMRSKARHFANLENRPNDRVYISYDESRGVYKVVGTGPDKPADYRFKL